MRGIAIRTDLGDIGTLVQISCTYWSTAHWKVSDSDIENGKTEIALFRLGQTNCDSFMVGTVVNTLPDGDRKVIIFKEKKKKVVSRNVFTSKNLARYEMDGDQYAPSKKKAASKKSKTKKK